MASRRPAALGSAPLIVEPAPALTAATTSASAWPAVLAWIVAGLVGLALLYGLGANLFTEMERSAASFRVHRPSVTHR